MRDVVAAVTDERQLPPREIAEALADRQEVRQGLARMMGVGQRVHDGHRREARQLVDRRVRERPDHDRGAVPR